MDEQEFTQRFHAALNAAAEAAERHYGRSVPRQFRVLLHGAGHPGDLMDLDEALSALYLGPEQSYLIFDVGFLEEDQGQSFMWVRASGHRPGSYSQTWNQPPGNGPFKVVGPVFGPSIRDRGLTF